MKTVVLLFLMLVPSLCFAMSLYTQDGVNFVFIDDGVGGATNLTIPQIIDNVENNIGDTKMKWLKVEQMAGHSLHQWRINHE